MLSKEFWALVGFVLFLLAPMLALPISGIWPLWTLHPMLLAVGAGTVVWIRWVLRGH